MGGGSRSAFWIELLASLLNRSLSICDQSEFSAAIGVARLAMFSDNNITDKKSIMKEIEVKKIFNPSDKKISILEKRYKNWKEIYLSNKKINKMYLI